MQKIFLGETAIPWQAAAAMNKEAFIERVSSAADNLAGPSTLKSLTAKALAFGFITTDDAAEVLRVQKDMGSKDDTQDAFSELLSSLV